MDNTRQINKMDLSYLIQRIIQNNIIKILIHRQNDKISQIF